MGFSSLLGNGLLKKNLEQSLEKGRISHFYLIAGPFGSGKHTLARLMAAAILCSEGDKPCLHCRNCRRVLENNHPDVITVDDPEHKNVAVRIIREMRDDVFIRPNESEHKIYILPQELGVEGQNALLKILEEPPAYGVFLLLTDNPEKLLPTIRSRCTLLQLQPLPENVLADALSRRFPAASREDLQAAYQRSGGFLGQAEQLLAEGAALPPQTEQFLKAYGGNDALELMRTLVPMEKWKRDALAEILQSWLELLEGALASRSGVAAVSPHARALGARRTAEELHRGVEHLAKALDYTRSNVSPAAVCGYLQWALRS